MQNFQTLTVSALKSVNNVCKLLHLLGISSPDLLLGLRPWTPLWDGPPDRLGYSPQIKIPGAATK